MPNCLRTLCVASAIFSAASCSSLPPIEDAGHDPNDAGKTADGGTGGGIGAGGGTAAGGGGSGAGGGSAAGGGSGVGGGSAAGGGAGGGCAAFARTQLAFVSAPQMLDARACSAPLRVELQNGCGGPVNTAMDLPVTFTASSATTEILGDGLCIGKPLVFVIPGGASSLDVFFHDPAPGMTTISASSPGLDGGSQVQTINCATGEKVCNGSSCIPAANCCTDLDCTAPRICNASGQCKLPPCSSFVNGCTTWTDLTASSANRTVTFSGSGYSPQCIRVSTSQSVTFAGDFSTHPVEQHCGPKEVTLGMFGSSRDATGFTSFGNYGFHCKNHPTFEKGAVKVP